MLRNMVGPGEVDQELKLDVQEECGKYGPVARVFIHEVGHWSIQEQEVAFLAVGRDVGWVMMCVTPLPNLRMQPHQPSPLPKLSSFQVYQSVRNSIFTDRRSPAPKPTLPYNIGRSDLRAI